MGGQETFMNSVPEAGNTESNRMWQSQPVHQLLQCGKDEWWEMHEMGIQRKISVFVLKTYVPYYISG